MSSLAPGQDFAGYTIEGVAGRGGMGVVYQAMQRTLDRTVALKLIAPELAATDMFRERFERESRVLAAIEHPNVIPVYEAGEVDGQLFISMRWVEGTDLGAVVPASGLEPRRAVGLIGQITAALDAAHASGLVHRDVKPGNALIETRRNGGEHLFLSDFGLSKRAGTGASLTGTGQMVGTLDYIAPEQIDGREVDARVDVYALGCDLYQVLTGRLPFERDTEAAKLWAHMSVAPPAPTGTRPELPAEFDAVVARAMAKDPADRFPSAGDFARAARAAAGLAPPAGSERSVAVGPAAPSEAPTAIVNGGGSATDITAWDAAAHADLAAHEETDVTR
ncbi:MAG: serine/threonine-protein kinase, partial [Thermoleophilaceae bacterium]